MESEIAELQNVRVSGAKKKEEQLREIASMHLELGHVRQFCQVMVQLEDWDQALAFAPGVSIEFWRELSMQYAEVLHAKGSVKQACQHWIAAGNVSKALSSHLNKGMHREAFVLAAQAMANRMPTASSSSSSSSCADTSSPAAAEEPEQRESASVSGCSKEMELVSISRIKALRECAMPVQAACCLLAINKVEAAVQILLAANELGLAMVVARILCQSVPSRVYSLMALQCAGVGNLEEALHYGQQSGSELTLDQICVLEAQRNPSGIESFLTSAHRRSRSTFLADGAQHVADGVPEQAVRCYMLGGDPTSGCTAALEALHPLMASDSWDWNSAKKIISAAGLCSIEQVSPDVKNQLLCYAAMVGLFEAFWRDFRMIWHGLVLTVEATAPTLPDLQRTKVLGHVQYFRAILQKLTGLGGTVYCSGQLLPSAAHPPGSESLASGMMLTGVALPLGSGGSITKSEASMWVQVNPFSPSRTGELLLRF
eukprot:TRINITY_DN6074_c0_g1_i1.p1 TRINITY_DN6074_c0_g1~~TRINITY_DN6074_c0_g1_i1.p1  ORF type:complete len:485 (-),score=115.62 TRINITY_DN6074_c0_g1_i1:334-1788(-)